MSSSPAGLAAQRYVSLTTFRRDGTPVSAPVWLAGDGDALVVVTYSQTGKIKRLRHTPRVTLTPCDMRGRVPEGAPTVEGTAAVIEDPAEVQRIASKVFGRYPVLGRVLPLLERLRGSKSGARVALRITGTT